MRFTFEISDGLVAAVDRLNDAAERGRDPRPVLEAIADDFGQIQERAFLTEGASLGRPWPALKPTYARRKRAAGRGNRILQLRGRHPRTGARGQRLWLAMTQASAKWQVRRITLDGMFQGTNLGIARIHQQGGTVRTPGRRKATRIPARPFAVVPRRDQDRWIGMIDDYLAGDTVAGGSRLGRFWR